MHKLYKVVAVLLSCFVLASCMSVLSFGADDENLVSDNLNDWSWTPSSQIHPTITYNTTSTNNQLQFVSGNASASCIKISDFDNSQWVSNHSYKLSFDLYGDFSIVNFNVVLSITNANSTGQLEVLYNCTENLRTAGNVKSVTLNFTPSDFSASFSAIALEFWFYKDSASAQNINISNISLIDVDENSSWFSRLWESIKSGFSSVLGRLSTLTTNIGNWFSDVGTWISDLGSDIGQFFVDLGQDIGEFFTALKNWLLYFRNPVYFDNQGNLVDENGNLIYTNPFSNSDFLTQLESWVTQLDNSIDDVLDGVGTGLDSIENVLTPFSAIIQGVPFLTIFIAFALGIIVIKKVIS